MTLPSYFSFRPKEGMIRRDSGTQSIHASPNHGVFIVRVKGHASMATEA
jgi:hypothetical protein